MTIIRGPEPLPEGEADRRAWQPGGGRSGHDPHPFDRRDVTHHPGADGGAMRGQPGQHLVLGQHRLPVRRTPARPSPNRATTSFTLVGSELNRVWETSP